MKASRKPAIERLEVRDLLTLTVGSFPATQGVPLTNPVAFFQAGDVQGTLPSDFSAVINFGDGTPSTTGQVEVVSDGRFEILSPHVYAAARPLPYPVVVTLLGLMNSSDIAAGFAFVTPPSTSPPAPPLSATGLTFSAQVNVMKAFQVATFTDTDSTAIASDFMASINWGDGTPASSGTISPDPNGGFDVSAPHTYTSAGAFTVTVMITKMGTSETATATSTANATYIALTAVPIVATAGQPISGTIANFMYTGSSTSPSFQALINWGDGNSSIGMVTPPTAGGTSYTISSSNPYVYSTPGSYNVTITVTDSSGDTASASSTAQVVNLTGSAVFSGELSSSIRWESRRGIAVTKNDQPVFQGTASPFAIVQLFARPSLSSNGFFLGQAITDSSGNWSLTVGPLARGTYIITAVVTNPGGPPSVMMPLSPLGGPPGGVIQIGQAGRERHRPHESKTSGMNVAIDGKGGVSAGYPRFELESNHRTLRRRS